MAFSTLGFSQSKWFFSADAAFSSSSYSTTINGGSTSTTTNTPAARALGINLGANYCLTEQWAVGLELGFNRSSSFTGWLNGQDSEQLRDVQNVFSVAPRVTFMLPISEQFVWTPNFYVGFGFGSYTSEQNSGGNVAEYTSDIFGWGLGLRPLSFDFHINDHLGINLSIGEISFAQSKITNGAGTYETATSDFNLTLNTGFTIGLRCYF